MTETTEHQAIPDVESLDEKLGEATMVRVPCHFNEHLPVAVRCKTCSEELERCLVDGARFYRHPNIRYGMCKPDATYRVSPSVILDAALRSLLNKTPVEPQKSVYRRLHESIGAIFVTPIGAGRFAIDVHLVRQKERSS